MRVEPLQNKDLGDNIEQPVVLDEYYDKSPE